MTGGRTYSAGVELSGVLMSIRSRHVRSILAGVKTHELRRRIPRRVVGMRVFIYSSGEEKAVTAQAEVAAVDTGPPQWIWSKYEHVLGVTREEFDEYFLGADMAHALCLTNVATSSRPITLEQLRNDFDLEPPQSWRYLRGDSWLKMSASLTG